MLEPRIVVDFGKILRSWDGFGVNYVEASQTRDYDHAPQDYGGFSLLGDEEQREIIELVFGENGLRPGVAKLFLDPWHQREPDSNYDLQVEGIASTAYDHHRTTGNMLNFLVPGYQMMRARGDEMKMLVTLYGPPAWMTRQRFVRGRDLDPRYRLELDKYIAAWVRHLRELHGLPVVYASLHNEGEDWIRWPRDGSGPGTTDHDYNLYWPPEQVVEHVKSLRRVLDANGLSQVGVAPGEPTGWYRFDAWGYADALVDDVEAIAGLGLITSHGFMGGDLYSEWYNDWRSAGTDALRQVRPELRAWVTSTSWSAMDVFFVDEMRHNIYSAKVNAIIPWACIQLQGHWEGGDPNPGTAFRVFEDGSYEVTKGYHFYKQVSRAGQPGMQVCKVSANDRHTGVLAFAGGASQHPDAFVLLNLADEPRRLPVTLRGSKYDRFDLYRTSPSENYRALGTVTLANGCLELEVAPRSVTTAFGR